MNFLVRFASKPLFLLGSALDLFRKFFGAVRASFWLWGSFLAPDWSPGKQSPFVIQSCVANIQLNLYLCDRHGDSRVLSQVWLTRSPYLGKTKNRPFGPDGLGTTPDLSQG